MIEPKDLIRTLANCAAEKATGTVRLQVGNQSKGFVFKNGQIINVVSNARDETLGRMLVDKGVLTEDQHQQSVEKMLASGKLQGEILIEMGVIQPHELYAQLEQQLGYKIERTVQLEGYDLEFSESLPEDITPLSVNLFRKILDGVKQHYTPDRMKKEADFKKESVISLNQQGRMQQTRWQLGPEEAATLKLIDGKRNTVEFLATATNKKIAAALLFMLKKFDFLSEDLPEEMKQLTPVDEGAEEQSKDESSGSDSPKSTPLQEIALRLPRASHFELLNLSTTSASTSVERAYNTMLKKLNLHAIEDHYELDDVGVAQQVLDKLTLAYVVLKDKTKRDAYLKQLAEKPKQEETEEDGKEQPVDKVLQAEVALHKTRLYMQLNQLKNAEEAAEQAIELNEEEAEHHVILAEVLMRQAVKTKRPPNPKIEEVLKQAVGKNPQYYRTFYQLGQYYKLIENFEKAEGAFNRALEYNPKLNQANIELRLVQKRLEKNNKTLFGLKLSGGKE